MRQLDYAGIFWTLFLVKATLMCAAFAVAMLFLGPTCGAPRRASAFPSPPIWRRTPPRRRPAHPPLVGRSAALRGLSIRIAAILTPVVAALFAGVIGMQWDAVSALSPWWLLRFDRSYLWQGCRFLSFSPPVVRAPAGEPSDSWCSRRSWRVGALYALSRADRREGKIAFATPALQHLSTLVFILAVTLGWGYYLERFDLLNSTTGSSTAWDTRPTT